MSVTVLGIVNDALLEIGAERITSLDSDLKRAVICKEQYPKVRDYVLTSHPWVFALKRVQLAQIDEEVSFDFTYQYQLPSDCLRVIKMDGVDSIYKIEGDRLLTDESVVKIQYIQAITDASRFTHNFAFAVAYLLAAKICYPITQSRELVNDLKASFLNVIREARSIDAQAMGSANDFVVDTFLNSRF